MLERGSHHVKFGGYLFRLAFNPVNPTNARGNFTFNGQWTGNAFADFLLGYPSVSQVGIGRADEHGRSTWFHAYVQDDWKVRSNLTFNYGLRYEINSEMTDVDNRLAAVDLPGRRFVIASDENGNLSPTAAPLLSQIPIPLRDVGGSRMEARTAAAQLSAVRSAPGYRVGAGRPTAGPWSTPVSACSSTSGRTAFSRRSPRRCRSSLRKRSRRPPTPFSRRRRCPRCSLAPANGTVGGSTMDWDFRTEYAKNYSVSVQRQVASATMVEVSFLRSAIVGADSSTVLNVPEPGPGAIGPRRPVPQLANITAIRWDGYSIFNGVTFRAEHRLSRGLAATMAYTLSKAIDDASDPGGTAFEANLPQDVRNMAAEEARASFDHRHRFVGSVTYALPNFGGSGNGWASKLGSNWQVNGIVLLESGAPFTVNLGTDRANIGAGPAQRPDMTCDPNQGRSPNGSSSGSIRAVSRCSRSSRSGMRHATPCCHPAMRTSTRPFRRTSAWVAAHACNSGGRSSIS